MQYRKSIGIQLALWPQSTELLSCLYGKKNTTVNHRSYTNPRKHRGNKDPDYWRCVSVLTCTCPAGIPIQPTATFLELTHSRGPFWPSAKSKLILGWTLGSKRNKSTLLAAHLFQGRSSHTLVPGESCFLSWNRLLSQSASCEGILEQEMPKAEIQNRSVMGKLPTPDPNQHQSNFMSSIKLFRHLTSVWPRTRGGNTHNWQHTSGPPRKGLD